MIPALDDSLSLETRLAPSYQLPLALLILGLGGGLLNLWLGSTVALFGIFLGVQAKLLTLVFTSQNLDIYRGTSLIRQFPYGDWQNWQIFYPPLPILFYFREVNSIHFLPVVFDPKTLRAALEQHIPLTKPLGDTSS
ncbi:MAG: DUF3119 family protein [Pseudanabaenaceae cyanobacterium bins.68]|nr:DUF3119 family protein [Pseudanabaenaceae cyanobacterium bins.68]